jgi:DtxR family Mn-dependent transcriptional regulator
MTKTPLSSNMEDYLEAIYLIVEQNKAARAKDISSHLGVNRSSVTGALQALSKKGLINYAPYGIITLTEKGEALAKGITRRHEILKSFFIDVLGVDEHNAEQSACGMEHSVSESILERLTQFIDFTRVCPRIDIHWIEDTSHFCERPKSWNECIGCIEHCLETVKEKRANNERILE